VRLRALIGIGVLVCVAPSWGHANPVVCIQGRWAGVRAETLPTGPAKRGLANKLQLAARKTDLEIQGTRMLLRYAGGEFEELRFAAHAISPSRAWVKTDRVVPPMKRDRVLFELLSRDRMRVGLVEHEPFVFRRVTAPPGDLIGVACDPPTSEPSSPTPLLGQWRFAGWQNEAGEPMDVPEAWISAFPDAQLVASGSQLQLTIKGQSVEASYELIRVAEDEVVLSTEAPLIDGRYGVKSTLSIVPKGETLRVESLNLAGRFLVLERVGEAPVLPESPTAGEAAPEPAKRELAPFEVPYTAQCKEGTERTGAPPPDGTEQWCEKLGPGGARVKHGWYIAWYPNGIKREAGRYRDGREHGTWMRWDEQGRNRVRAEFSDGVQDGTLIRWDRHGREQHYLIYRDGKPAR